MDKGSLWIGGSDCALAAFCLFLFSALALLPVAVGLEGGLGGLGLGVGLGGVGVGLGGWVGGWGRLGFGGWVRVRG